LAQRRKTPVGARLARESVVSGTINFDWIDAIASKLCSYRVIERLLD